MWPHKHRSTDFSPALTAAQDMPPYPATTDTRPDPEYRAASRRRAARTVGAAALVVAAKLSAMGFSDVAQGIEDGKNAVRDAQTAVHEVYDYSGENPIYRQHGTFVLTGLGTRDSSETATSLDAHRELGSVYGFEYSNKEFNTIDMAQRIIQQASRDGLHFISLDGYSLGGAAALDIAAYIHQKEPDLRVVSVVLNSSPIGDGSLTERSQDGITIMNKILSIYPDFVYYARGRVAVEVINRNERYLRPMACVESTDFGMYDPSEFRYNGTRYTFDRQAFMRELDDVKQRMSDEDTASSSLVKAQADFLTLSDYNTNLRILAKPPKNGDARSPRPLITYTRAAMAANDSVVDIDRSQRNITRALERYGNPRLALTANVGHANPMERPNEYRQMIHEQIHPTLVRQLIIGTLQRELRRTTTEPGLTPQHDEALPGGG